MADKKVISEDEAKKRAKKIRDLKPGFVVTMRVDVALAYMKDRNLVVSRWLGDGSILEVKPNPNKGESNATSKSTHANPAMGVTDESARKEE